MPKSNKVLQYVMIGYNGTSYTTPYRVVMGNYIFMCTSRFCNLIRNKKPERLTFTYLAADRLKPMEDATILLYDVEESRVVADMYLTDGERIPTQCRMPSSVYTHTWFPTYGTYEEPKCTCVCNCEAKNNTRV